MLNAGVDQSATVPESARVKASIWAQWGALALIFVLAFALRLVLSQMDRVVWGDEPFYLWLGRNWITGQGYSFIGHPDVHHGPLFPWLSGILYLVTHDMALSSEILYVVFGSLLVFPVYAIGNEVYGRPPNGGIGGRRVGLAAAALSAVFPALTASVLHWGSMTEPIYMFCVYVGLWAGLVMLRPLNGKLAKETKTAKEGSGKGAKEEKSKDAKETKTTKGKRLSRLCRSGWPYAVAGGAFGLAYLTRPEAVGYWVVVGIFVVLFRAYRRAWSRAFWRRMLVYLVAFALAFGPYAVYTRVHTGSWMVSEKVGVAYLTGIGLAHGDTAAFDKATWGLDSTGLETFFFSSESYNVSMLGLILADPRTFANVLVLNAMRFVQVLIDWTLFPYVLLPLVALGLLRQGWTRQRTLKELYLLGSMVPVAAFTLFYIQARYLVAVIPVLILWTACGLAGFSDWLIATVAGLRSPTGSKDGKSKAAEEAKDAKAGEAPSNGGGASPKEAVGEGLYGHIPGALRSLFEIGPVLLVVAILLLVQPHVISMVTNVGSVRPAHKSAGEYLFRTIARDAVIMSRYPAIAFHADTRWVPTPNASVAEVLNYARHKGAQYWVIDERELRYRPQFGDLIAGSRLPPELKLLYMDDSESDRLVIYALSF